MRKQDIEGFMGKQKFRLSHMIPNAWFYRLRDMNTPNNNSLSTSKYHPKNSFCYTPKVYSSPSTINRPLVPKHVLGSIYIRPTESTHDTNQDLVLSPSSSCYESPLFESLDTCGCGVVSSSTACANFEFNETVQDSSGYHELNQEIEHLKPPRIITKFKENEESSVSIKILKENINKNDHPSRKELVSGVNTRSNKSTTVKVCKRVDDQNKFSTSCCIVKSTFDPCNDLKESMMEMIVDYNLQESQDLEKLLAFYLSLNSNKYHDMIIKAFEEIWLTFDFLI